MSQTPCRFFQRGACSYGSQCRYLHEGQQTNNSGGGVGSSFSGGARSGQQQLLSTFNLPTVEVIKTDLTEKPTWILSSFGAGKDPPAQLIDGKDVSPEEMRVLFYQCRENNTLPDYEQEWNRLNAQATGQIQNILSDLPGAIQYLQKSQDTRAQVYKYTTPGATDGSASSSSFTMNQEQPKPNAFGTPASPFGQPSAFGAPSNPNPFGQPSQPTSAFGAVASPFAANPAQPTFGQSSFGAPSALKPAFGQPAFGQSSFGQAPTGPSAGSPFTSTPQAQGAGAFGRPTFGQSAFATAAASGTTPGQPAFGQSSFGQRPAFGQSTFGTTSSLAPSPFAAAAAANNGGGLNPSPFAAAANTTASPFAQAQNQQPQAGPANPFGQPSTPVTNNTSPFSNVNPFQSAQQQQPPATPGGTANTNPFGQPPVPQTPTQNPNPFGVSQANAFQTPQQGAGGLGMGGLGGALAGNAGASSGQGQAQAPQTPGGSRKKWDDPEITYTPAETEAFRAEMFTIGIVPMVAPPRALCGV